jgi:glycerate dehydrogenase
VYDRTPPAETRARCHEAMLETEPPAPDHPLLTARNCVITPHFGWATRAARERLLATVVENVQAFLSGRARHVVN